MHQSLESLEKTIAYTFKAPVIAVPFLNNDMPSRIMRGKLAFLGDRVANMILCEHMFDNEDKFQIMAQKTQEFTSNAQMAGWAQRLDLYDSTPRLSIHDCATHFEALVAAIYKDGGLDAAKTFVLSQIAAGPCTYIETCKHNPSGYRYPASKGYMHL